MTNRRAATPGAARRRAAAIFLLLPAALLAHAPPTPIPVPPFHAQSNTLVDSKGTLFVLRGVNFPGLETGSPSVAVMTAFTFQIIQQRWNMNAVRIPVSVSLWKADPTRYLQQVTTAIAAANRQSLVVVLAACAFDDSGLPTNDVLDFWRAAAAQLKDTPGVIFSLYHQPSPRNIPGATPGTHRAADWSVWLRGGALTGGRTAIGMQTLADAIRSTGAKQVIAAPAFHDALGFQGLTADMYLRDANVVYEIHPFFDQGLTDADRDRTFGFLLADVPVFAGAWGATFGTPDASCLALPANVIDATSALYQAVVYFDRRGVSWTAADFAPGSLIRGFDDYAATALGSNWNCAANDGRTGIGQFVLFWMTGDPNGFGSLDLQQMASAAGGPPGPVAPGQLISIYGQNIGPDPPLGPAFISGLVATSLSDVQVLFDGVPAPILFAWYYQAIVQVPYEVASRPATSLQLTYRGILSNVVQLAIAPAAPGIFTNVPGGSDARVLNQDGSINDALNPAPRGSIISIFATGAGQTAPASITGAPAALPLPAMALPVTAAIGGRSAEVLYSGPAPGLVGVMQVNARVPADAPIESTPDRASLAISVGGAASRAGVILWIR